MSIEITGTFEDGKFARVLHNGNRFRVKTVTASDEQTVWPGSSANLGNTVDRWKPFANGVQAPNDLSDADEWTATNLTVAADGQTLTETAASGEHRVQQTFTFTAVEWVVSFKVERQTIPEIQVRCDDGTTTFSAFFDLRDGTVGTQSNCTGVIEDLGNDQFECLIYFTAAAGTGFIQLRAADGAESASYAGSTDNTVKVLRAAANESLATLRYDLFSAQSGDCIAIAAHNLGSGAGRITIQHDSNEDDTWTTIDDLSPVDDSPILFFFDAISSVRWRIQVDRCVLPEIGVFRVGAALKMQQAFYGGFKVPRMDRNVEVLGNMSGSAQLLGRSRKRVNLRVAYNWTHLKYAWVRANLDGPNGLIQSVEVEPLFVAWRPSETEDVEYLMMASVTAPQSMSLSDLWQFGMSGEAHAYE